MRGSHEWVLSAEVDEESADGRIDIELGEQKHNPRALAHQRQWPRRGLVVLALGTVVAIAALLSIRDSHSAAAIQPAYPSVHISTGPGTWLWRDGWLRSSVWTVGVDVAPGTYTATVPTGPGSCTWTRFVSQNELLVVAGQGTGRPGHKVTVVIKPGDREVVAVDCGWFSPAPGTPAGPPPAPGPR